VSQENVEIMRRVYRAWQQHGFAVVPEPMDPEIEYVNPQHAVEPGARHAQFVGRRPVRRAPAATGA
jgi:hypothetical protein